MRKRLKEAPMVGKVTIVHLSIPDMADVMKSAPSLMMSTLVIYHNLIQKAKWANFGHKIRQDSDVHTIMFEEAGDAVKFCLQVILNIAFIFELSSTVIGPVGTTSFGQAEVEQRVV